MNTTAPRRSFAPYFIGFIVVAILASLGMWQITRGWEKRDRLNAYTGEEGHAQYYEGMELRPFQQLRLRGEFDSARQVLIDNMIVDSRNGHFVITPLRIDGSDRTLLVNRGWVAPGDDLPAQITVAESMRTVYGRVGQLPRAGMRMGDPFESGGDWPRHAVLPLAEEVGELLGEELAPFVLLLDAEQPDGFVRKWQPGEMSASRHFGYAFQWFAMATMLSGLLAWNYRKRKSG